MNVRIAQLLSFNAGSWFDGELEMNQYTVKLWMITQSIDPEEQNIAFRRAKHFIYSELDSTIFVDSTDETKCAELARAGLNITTLPGDPADQLIGIMLFHKLNAIMEGRIAVIEVEISAGDAVIYLHGENETSESLIRPDWWTSTDLTHSDFTVDESGKVLSIPQSASWRDFDLAWPDSEEPADTGNIVVFADFKQTDEPK
jgi:hypothetical protein